MNGQKYMQQNFTAVVLFWFDIMRVKTVREREKKKKFPQIHYNSTLIGKLGLGPGWH